MTQVTMIDAVNVAQMVARPFLYTARATGMRYNHAYPVDTHRY